MEVVRVGQEYSKWPSVSVIVPCRNEHVHINDCISSILTNRYPGVLEIIIVDGMSNDGTREKINMLKLNNPCIKMVDNPKHNTPAALNKGIVAAIGDFIMRLDAHCFLRNGYIETAIKTLLQNKKYGCVGGRTVPVAFNSSTMQLAIAALFENRFGVGNSYFRLPGTSLRKVDTLAFGIYPKKIFKEIGMFNELLYRNQDIEYNYRLRKKGYEIILNPKIETLYYPRKTICSLWYQNYANGYWNVITQKIAPGVLSVRHFVPLAFVISLVMLIAGSFISKIFALTLAIIVTTYISITLLESAKTALRNKNPRLLAMVILFPILHISYGIGSICGIGYIIKGKA